MAKALRSKGRIARRPAIVTERAKEVLAFIVEYRSKVGISPTYREIGQACRISSTSLVSLYLGQLERAELIKRLRDVPRGIIVVMNDE
jgi:SOS-response transcriptional repressor LexA